MGRAYLKSQRIDQWQNGYPNQSSIEQDIASKKGFFLTDGTELFAYLCMDMDGEPAYNNIKGNWLKLSVSNIKFTAFELTQMVIIKLCSM